MTILQDLFLLFDFALHKRDRVIQIVYFLLSKPFFEFFVYNILVG